MKQSGWVCLCLILVMCFSLPVFAQPSDKSVETILIDDFDGGDEGFMWPREGQDGVSLVWVVKESDFPQFDSAYDESEDDVDSYGRPVGKLEDYLKCGYVSGIPNSLKAYSLDPENALVFGAQISFKYKGYNWMEIYPQAKEADENNKKEIGVPLSGNVTQIDFWVWGANYKYTLEVVVRDCLGTVHVLPATVLSFNGWKNIVVQIPSWLKQQSRSRSVLDNMYFLGFRITSDPAEYTNDFAVYFDRIRYTTNTLNSVYDGYDLRDAGFESQGR